MEGIIGAITTEASKQLIGLMVSKARTFLNSNANLNSLEDELLKLAARKCSILESIDCGVREGKSISSQTNKWLEDVAETEHDAQQILEEIPERRILGLSSVSARYRSSKASAEALGKVKRLVDSCNFQVMLENKRSPIRAVETREAASLDGQEAATEMLRRLAEFVKDNSVNRVAVWGTGGVGKTTLVKNFNNKFEFLLTELFDIVIWVTVSRDMDLAQVQAQIAERLNLEFYAGESMHRRANRLHRRLMLRRKSLLIFDDVWQKIDLEDVGVPQGDNQGKCKIIMTTRVFDVCRDMMTDEDIKVDVLNDDASWNLFAQMAGQEVEREDINCLARAICRKCCGLPLAIRTVAMSMRTKKMIELWRDTLHQLKCPSPRSWMLEKEVFLPLKVSYNSLPSKIHQDCFLYCSLYLANSSINVDELVQCWVADGLIDRHQNLDESFNNGIALIESLKDSCMLEQGDRPGTVKMHDVWRDLALYICCTEQERGFYCHSSVVSLYEDTPETPHKVSKPSLRRVSLVSTNTTDLPTRWTSQELTVLLLQGNPIKRIPESSFRELRQLRYVNLSSTHITSLPLSLLLLKKLHSLLLRDCWLIERLPPLGALHSLEFLDLSGTRLRELPKEMGKLTRLRTLNLSRTYHLEHIEFGTLSCLSSLEALDMSFSAYKWDKKSNLGEQRAAFDELLPLEKLSTLHLRLDTFDCLPERANSLMERLRKFRIWVSMRSCESGYLPIQQDEKRAILRGVDLMVQNRGLEVLLQHCTALDLVSCGGISELSEIVTRTSLNGQQNLKSITITGCPWIRNILSGEKILRPVLTNLEHLGLYHLGNLEKILDGMVPKGCFGKLKTIEISNCQKLKKLSSYALLRQIRNLQEVKISECEEMKFIFSAKVSRRFLPKLRAIEIRDLKSLRTICHGNSTFPSLGRIEVSNCPKLQKLPFSFCRGCAIREIRGDLEWWNNLVWPDEDTKASLQERFQVFITTPRRREDTQG
ncbi:disease resistance protein At4g27190-like [Punica granatum]|uniref:Disease resistance protein At4g27190-like n=1 Tax=Punica granatum TaxID=22663 RepID=A0A6P8C194_PUNGR|nr:disease resistance protein At4g27190-like [Punica granatum]